MDYDLEKRNKEAHLEVLSANLRDAAARVTETLAAEEKASERLCRIEETIVAKKKELADVEKRLDKDLTVREKKLAQKESRVSERDAKSKQMLSEAKKIVSDLSSEASMINTRISILDAEEVSHVENLASLEIQIGSKQDICLNLEDNISKLRENMASMEVEVKVKAENLLILESLISEKTSEIEYLDKRIEERNDALSGKFQGLTKKESDLATKERDLTIYANRLRRLYKEKFNTDIAI